MGFAKGLGATALALALFACGGDDSGPPRTGDGGNGGGSGGTPTPSPTPTPVSYTKFADLTGTQTFQSTCGGKEVYYGDDFIFGGTAFGEGIAITSNRSVPDYGIAIPQFVYNQPFDVAFTQADRDASSTETVERYTKVDEAGRRQRFNIARVSINSVELDYVRQTSFMAVRETGFLDIRCAIGVPTELSDIPATTKTYGNAFATGVLERVENAGITNSGPFHVYSTSPTTATATANPATGLIEITVNLKGRESANDPVEDLGTYTARTTIDGSKQSFMDVATNADNVVVGNFGGWFFGPQGVTMAVSFGITDRRADDSEVRFGGLVFLR